MSIPRQNISGLQFIALLRMGNTSVLKFSFNMEHCTIFHFNTTNRSLFVCEVVIVYFFVFDSPDPKDYSGRTPLSYSAKHGHAEATRILLKAGIFSVPFSLILIVSFLH